MLLPEDVLYYCTIHGSAVAKRFNPEEVRYCASCGVKLDAQVLKPNTQIIFTQHPQELFVG